MKIVRILACKWTSYSTCKNAETNLIFFKKEREIKINRNPFLFCVPPENKEVSNN